MRVKEWKLLMKLKACEYEHVTSSAVDERYDDDYKLIEGDNWYVSIMLNGGVVMQLPDHARIILENDGSLLIQVLRDIEIDD